MREITNRLVHTALLRTTRQQQPHTRDGEAPQGMEAAGDKRVHQRWQTLRDTKRVPQPDRRPGT
eukprot:1960822-Rhodomonas_salina.1